MALSQRRLLGLLTLLVVGALAAIGCGRRPRSRKESRAPLRRKKGSRRVDRPHQAEEDAHREEGQRWAKRHEGTVGGTAGGEASGRFGGVVASYEVAQSEIDEEGGEQKVGEYRVGYLVEPAEGWWEGAPENLAWRGPTAEETNHIEILPFGAETGLLVPGAEITLTVLDESGEVVESKPLEFYHGEFYHYANNFSLPGSGTYALRPEITPPTFLRHGTEEGEGRVLTEPVVVEFESVEIDTEEG